MAASVQSATVAGSRLTLPTYKQVKETAYELEWADIVTLDLSTFDEPGGKQALAAQLFEAMQTIGFFYIINFGLTQEEVDQQFGIGKAFFELPLDEKLKYRADLDHGKYYGYKPAGIVGAVSRAPDNVEIYSIPKFIPELQRPQPDIVRDNMPATEHFVRHIHFQIAEKLLVLFAILLELPEDHFTRTHRYDALSDCSLRYMKYNSEDAATNKKKGNVWVKGHTDTGSLTLLFRQPVAALQVWTPDGKWRWVKPFRDSITVNVADCLDLVTRGFLKSSIHRVVTPPPDQAEQDRLGVLYFVRPDSDMKLEIVKSPVLERLGYKVDGEDEVAAANITVGEWIQARVKLVYDEALSSKEEYHVVKGLKTKTYN